MKKVLCGILSMSIILSMTGCVSSESKKRDLTIYTALEEEQVSSYLEGFREENPDIKVNLIMDSHGVIASKILAEKDNPQADVVWGLSAMNMIDLEKSGVLKEYKPEGLERVSGKYKDKKEVPTWVGMTATETAFVVNYKELEDMGLEIPRSYEDLIKPEYRGLISMPNPASSGTGYLTVSAFIQLMGEEGWSYMDKLHKNIGVYTHSGSKPAKLAGAGEYPIGITFGYRGIKQMETGEPVKVIFPEEGSGWDLECNALVNKKEINEEARVFLDWAISDKAMEYYSQNVAVTSVKRENEPPEGYLDDPIQQLIENDLEWGANNREFILNTWESKYGSKSESK